MFLGYNTNGLAHHDPFQAVELLAQLGYRGVGLTLDHGPLNPFGPDFSRNIQAMADLLQRLQMRSVIETGARFLLDPWQKHEPTLVSATATERDRRVDFYRRAIDAARVLSSDCVSLWSGIVRCAPAGDANESPEEIWSRLISGLQPVLDHAMQGGAGKRELPIGFEPEPGMFVDSMAGYAELLARLPAEHLRLTLDIGHLQCQGELPLTEQIVRWAPRLVNVHLEDMRGGEHEHLMFGEGEIDFPPVMTALKTAGYQGGVYVELSRHSHQGPTAARKAMEFLRPLVDE